MSVGDVIVIGEVAMSVAGVGFQQADVDSEDLIIDRTWRQVIDEPRPIGPTVRTIVAGWSAPTSTISGSGTTIEGIMR
jgi:hypothetical protein